MRVAAIDVGSNSLKLAVGEVKVGGVRVVDTHRITLQIGRLVERDGALGADCIGEVATAAADLATRARLAGARRLDVVGTSAVREASDGDALAAAVHKATGVPLRCLSGEAEAHLVSRAMEVALGMPLREAVMIDIGGGSTEVVHCDGGLVTGRWSIPVGAVRLTQRLELQQDESLSADQCASLAAAIAEACGDVPTAQPGMRAFGCGGTLTTMARLMHFGTPPEAVGPDGADRRHVEFEAIEALTQRLNAASLSERMELTGLDADRAAILPAGAAIACWLGERLQLFDMQVLEHGIRVGLLAELAER